LVLLFSAQLSLLLAQLLLRGVCAEGARVLRAAAAGWLKALRAPS